MRKKYADIITHYPVDAPGQTRGTSEIYSTGTECIALPVEGATGYQLGGVPAVDSWKNKGFSLIELIIILVILSIGCSLAYPNITRWIENYRLKTTAQQLVSDLQFAKMKAITERVQYRVSFNSAGKTYTIEKGNLASGSTTWAQVGIVRQFASETNPYYAKGVSINNNFINDNVIFSPSGTTSPAGTITFNTVNYAKNVVVSLSGRINVN